MNGCHHVIRVDGSIKDKSHVLGASVGEAGYLGSQ